MAKDYKKGDQYRLYYDTANDWDTPTWVWIKAFSDPTISPNKGEVAVEEQNADTGYLHGVGDPEFAFTLHNDKGDANVQALIDATQSGAMVHLAFADGDIATTGTDYDHMECVLFSSASAGRGNAASHDVTAKRHANSDNTITSVTAA